MYTSINNTGRLSGVNRGQYSRRVVGGLLNPYIYIYIYILLCYYDYYLYIIIVIHIYIYIHIFILIKGGDCPDSRDKSQENTAPPPCFEHPLTLPLCSL